MINILREYIKYQLKARRRHGIHSPFVYNFGDKCLNSSVPKKELQGFKELESKFLKNESQVVFKSSHDLPKNIKPNASTGEITKRNNINLKVRKLLYRITTYYSVQNILEFGTATGLGTYMLSSGNKKASITTIEANKDLFKFAKSNFPPHKKENIVFVHDRFPRFLKSINNVKTFDMVLFTGYPWDIRYIKNTFSDLYPFLHDETIVVINGIRKSEELFQLWKDIIQNPRYHLSIDLFQTGLLLPRHHQQKEHFIIRY